MFAIGGLILFFVGLYFLTQIQEAINNIKIIRKELDELKSDMDDYMQYTAERIDETYLNVWDLNEVRHKRERQQNASILDIPDQDWYNDK